MIVKGLAKRPALRWRLFSVYLVITRQKRHEPRVAQGKAVPHERCDVDAEQDVGGQRAADRENELRPHRREMR